MKKEQNIDDLIRQKLENYAVFPPPGVWENVQKELSLKNRESRIIYIRWISAAAVLLMALVAGWYFYSLPGTENLVTIAPAQSKTEQIVKSEPDQNKIAEESKIGPSINKISNSHLNLRNDSKNGINPLSVQATASLLNQRNHDRLSYLQGKTERVAEKEIPVINLPPQATGKQITPEELTMIDQMIIAENIKSNNQISTAQDKWKMGAYLSPGYSSYSANYDKTYYQNMTKSSGNGNTNLGGGISVQYKTSKRWILESGIYYAQNDQTTGRSDNLFAFGTNADAIASPNNKEMYSNVVSINKGNVAMNSIAGVISLKSIPNGASIVSQIESPKNGLSNMVSPVSEFSQQFDFMEIPVYVRYRLVDNRFGIELLSGLSSGILVGNNAYIENENGKQQIGKTMDISTFNISAVAGIGANYELGKRFSVSLEPRFSYYLNSINNSNYIEFRPYRIGIFTGLTYDF